MQLDEENKPEGCQTRGEGGRETKDRFGARKGQENIDESEWTREGKENGERKANKTWREGPRNACTTSGAKEGRQTRSASRWIFFFVKLNVSCGKKREKKKQCTHIYTYTWKHARTHAHAQHDKENPKARLQRGSRRPEPKEQGLTS